MRKKKNKHWSLSTGTRPWRQSGSRWIQGWGKSLCGQDLGQGKQVMRSLATPGSGASQGQSAL